MITGPIGSGKSTLAKKLSEHFGGEGMKVGGLLSLRLMERDITIGYNLVDIETGRTLTLALPPERFPTYDPSWDDSLHFGPEYFGGRPCRYHFSQPALSMGNAVFRDIGRRLDRMDIVIIDEIGFLELREQGLFEGVRLVRSARNFDGSVIVVARNFLSRDVMALFDIPMDTIRLEDGPDRAFDMIMKRIFIAGNE